MPPSSREKVARHREALRRQGLRPVQIWVPDTRSPDFIAAAQRDCRAINASPDEAEATAWIESVSVLDSEPGE